MLREGLVAIMPAGACLPLFAYHRIVHVWYPESSLEISSVVQ